MTTKPAGPPSGAATTTVSHSVQFYETDAMGIVHHSNYVRFLEHVRVAFLDEHDKSYVAYVADGFHMPVTRVSVQYKRPTRFADVIEITGWLAWVRHASFGFAYQLKVASELVAWGETDHALTDGAGRPRRIPEPTRVRMEGWLGMLARVEPRPLSARTEERALRAAREPREGQP